MIAKAGSSGSCITLRSLILALFLIAINSYWLIQAELVRYSGHPTCISLFFNVICIICTLVLLNALIRKIYPKLALRREELLAIYCMLCVASFIAGHDLMQVLIPQLGQAFWFATPENEWEVFQKYLPAWLTISDKSALQGLYESKTTIYLPGYIGYIRAWLPVILIWSGFLTVVVFTMYSLNVILRKQWMDNEKLTYPIARLPLELINDAGSLRFFRRKIVLAGLIIAALINLLNGFSFLYPVIPSIPIKQRDIGHLFAAEPWNAIGWMPISFYPFVIGLGFLIPLDLSFSCWFFYLFYKSSLVLGKATGLARSTISLHPNEQMLGAYVGVLMIAIWRYRHYLVDVLSSSFRQTKATDKDEPMSYRSALLGTFIGFALLVAFSVKAGMTLWVAVFFFVLYFAISVSVTRLRAELGAPVHDLWSVGSTGPDTFIAATFGTRKFDPRTLSVLTLYYGFNRDYRGHAMPHQLESLKVADALNLNWKRFGFAVIIAAFFGSISSFWVFLHSYHKIGFQGGFGWESFSRLQRWFFYPSAPDVSSPGFLSLGVTFTILLMAIRLRFIWFPFHPLGYALAPSWSMNLIWFPLLVSWGVKLFVLRYGGLKLLRQFIPFFLGLILGEFIIGGFWTLMGIFLGIPTYAFWI